MRGEADASRKPFACATVSYEPNSAGVMKLTGGTAKDSHDAKVDYKLFAVAAPESPRVSGSAKASSGGVGTLPEEPPRSASE